MLHDDVINELEKEYKKSDKTKYTILFLKGLSNAEVSFETQALSMMKNYHFHKYSKSIYEDSDPKRLKEYKKPILERSCTCF